MPENKTEETKLNLDDYVLKQDANLPELAREVRAGLAKILPGATLREVVECCDEWKVESTHRDYESVLSDMQSLRQKSTKYITRDTILSFNSDDVQTYVAFWLDDSKIATDLTEDQTRAVYGIIKPYIIQEAEVEKGDN
jgi:hypothetical protein